jgi:hypothetical protein
MVMTLVKYCIKCGKENDDQAVFCTACGQRFPEQSPSAGPEAGTPAAAQTPSLLTAEMGPGAHKHVLTDVYLKDSSGKVLLVARKRSLLHQEYTIVDGTEAVKGFLESKAHLGHTSLNVQDANKVTQGAVQVSNFEEKGMPPKVWIEDPSGDKLGSVDFTNGFLAFSGIGPDGMVIFGARFSAASGATDRLQEFATKSYSIQLVNPDFPLPTLLAIIAAIDRG